MNAYIITIKDDMNSELASEHCWESSFDVGNDFDIKKFDATKASEAAMSMVANGLEWNWPWVEQQIDFKSGLTKNPYQTNDPNKRIACFLSHYRLWHQCIKEETPILVLEHDARFISRLDLKKVTEETPYDITGINNPLMATRKSKSYYNTIALLENEYQPVPTIDDITIPQGLAGNSAYIIKPNGAKKMLELCKEYGAWPNDALMCKQLVPSLGVTKKFYTEVQGTRSTTSL